MKFVSVPTSKGRFGNASVVCFAVFRRHFTVRGPDIKFSGSFYRFCCFQAILIALAAVAAAAPQYGYPTPASRTPAPTPPPTPAPTPGYEYQEPQQTYLAPGTRAEGGEEAPEEPEEAVPILKDERVNNEDGSYTVDVETGNGIVNSEAGSINGEGGFVKSGHYS